ncbi:MAG TPA: hypothetical protein VF449_07060 [Parvibaculum sp.]
MATSQQTAPRATATGKALAAGLIAKLQTTAIEAARGFDLTEAAAAGGYVAIGLYSVALLVNVALGY